MRCCICLFAILVAVSGFADELKFKSKDANKAVNTYQQNLKKLDAASLNVPLGTTGEQLSVWMYGDPPDRMGVRFKGPQELIQTIKEHVPDSEFIKPGKKGKPMIDAERPVDILDKEKWTEQHEWLLKTIRQFDNMLSPHIKG